LALDWNYEYLLKQPAFLEKIMINLISEGETKRFKMLLQKFENCFNDHQYLDALLDCAGYGFKKTALYTSNDVDKFKLILRRWPYDSYTF